MIRKLRKSLGKKYKSSEKERKNWERENLMTPKSYEHYAKVFDELREHYPEIKDDLDTMQSMMEAHIYKKIGPVYDKLYHMAKALHDKYKQADDADREKKHDKWWAENVTAKGRKGITFQEMAVNICNELRTEPPRVSSVMHGYMEDINHMASREPWYFMGPEDE